MARIAHPARPWGVVVLVLLVLFVALFEWDWLRGPLERYVLEKTHREFRIAHLNVRLGWAPTIEMREVFFANAPWAGTEPMAKIGSLEFSVSLRDAFEGRLLIPRVALADAELAFERLADGRRNWILSEPSGVSPSPLRISSLSVTRGKLSYVDRGLPFTLSVAVSTFDPAASANAANASAAPVNTAYTTRYEFEGLYHDAKFAGNALTGDVLSFQESGLSFPLRGQLQAATTRLDVEGSVADAARLSAIDVQLRMSGQTLANLYPFLLLPLPASPPYTLEGHLKLDGKRYAMDDIRGRIGSTDISGNAAYLQRSPRPLLQAKLHSQLLRLSDLGPLIGVTTKSSAPAAPPTQAETNTRPAAQAKERKTSGDRVLPAATVPGERLLPAGTFEGGRLKAIDAEADLDADKLLAPHRLEVDQMRVSLRLTDGVLKLDPFNVGIAGGQIESRILLDAREPTLRATVDVDAKRLRLGQLLPSSPKIAQSTGIVGARLRLQGTGNSIADLAAKADGEISGAVSKGRVSNLIDAAAGLNGGKVIGLLIGGDKDIPIRCGAAAFDVKAGQGRSRLFVVDTEQTRIDGTGSFDLANERFDMTIAPQPKQAGILSLRTPVRLYGSFRHPEFSLEKKDLILRAGGAIALAVVAPLAAILPLIETGPGSDTDCSRVLAEARKSDGQPAKK